MSRLAAHCCPLEVGAISCYCRPCASPSVYLKLRKLWSGTSPATSTMQAVQSVQSPGRPPVVTARSLLGRGRAKRFRPGVGPQTFPRQAMLRLGGQLKESGAPTPDDQPVAVRWQLQNAKVLPSLQAHVTRVARLMLRRLWPVVAEGASSVFGGEEAA